MTLASYQARLKYLNPRLRLRKRVQLRMPNDETIGIGGVYLGTRYMGVAFNDGDFTLKGLPFKYDYHWNEQRKEWYRTLVRRMKRGREGLNRLLIGKRILKHRWEKQLIHI